MNWLLIVPVVIFGLSVLIWLNRIHRRLEQIRRLLLSPQQRQEEDEARNVKKEQRRPRLGS